MYSSHDRVRATKRKKRTQWNKRRWNEKKVPLKIKREKATKKKNKKKKKEEDRQQKHKNKSSSPGKRETCLSTFSNRTNDIHNDINRDYNTTDKKDLTLRKQKNKAIAKKKKK